MLVIYQSGNLALRKKPILRQKRTKLGRKPTFFLINSQRYLQYQKTATFGTYFWILLMNSLNLQKICQESEYTALLLIQLVSIYLLDLVLVFCKPIYLKEKNRVRIIH